jgi:dTDP-4-dehydrorhamnose reductase
LKTIFLTGVSGQLGTDLSKLIKIKNKNYQLFAPLREELDLVDFESVLKRIIMVKPDIIIHSAAYTNVLQAEHDKEACYLGNVVATSNLIKACNLVNAVFVLISTDFVFDGRISRPYNIYDITNPLNYYGKCKEQAEVMVRASLSRYFIIRTSWLFSCNSGNFMTKIIHACKQKNEIFVVQDEVASPTSTVFLSKVILHIIENSIFGIYHVSNSGSCSRFEFASKIVEKMNLNCKVTPIDTLSDSSVNRPKYSVLQNNWKTEDLYHQNWDEAIDEIVDLLK